MRGGGGGLDWSFRPPQFLSFSNRPFCLRDASFVFRPETNKNPNDGIFFLNKSRKTFIIFIIIVSPQNKLYNIIRRLILPQNFLQKAVLPTKKQTNIDTKKENKCSPITLPKDKNPPCNERLVQHHLVMKEQ